jgi:3-oxoacyl-[acyl-carrier protein] reductase
MTGRLENKVALIVGSARGIGKGIAQRFAEEGARLVLADTEAEAGRATAGELDAAFIRTDISQIADAEAAVALALDRYGRLDIVVQNAGIYPWQLIENTSPDDWDRVMAVNLRGPFLVAKHVAPEMAKRRYGKIINIGSGTAVRGIPWLMHYVTSKGGIMAMTRAMSRELGDDGIRVNTLMPGFTLSDTIVAENPGHVKTARDRAIASRALKRDETPEDLLGTLIFLASADSDFITGQMIAVDGGNVNT